MDKKENAQRGTGQKENVYSEHTISPDGCQEPIENIIIVGNEEDEDGLNSLNSSLFTAIVLSPVLDADTKEVLADKNVYLTSFDPVLQDELRSIASTISKVDFPSESISKFITDLQEKFDGRRVLIEVAEIFRQSKLIYSNRLNGEEPPEMPVTSDDLRSDISALLKMDVLEREVQRKELSKKYGVRTSVIDSFLKVLEDQAKGEGSTDIVTTDDAWHAAVDGAALLNNIKALIQKHVVLPAITAVAVAVWILLTYCFDAFRILPLLGIVSPEKRCGKTTAMDLLQGTCTIALR